MTLTHEEVVELFVKQYSGYLADERGDWMVTSEKGFDELAYLGRPENVEGNTFTIPIEFTDEDNDTEQPRHRLRFTITLEDNK